MKEVPLSVVPRDGVGKGAARQTRFGGNIPGILYGPETTPKPIMMNAKVFRAAVKSAEGTTAIFNIEVGGKTSKAIIREMQRDPVTSSIMHVDFHAISMNKPLHLSIPIRFIGTPIGVKADGGIMQTTMREIEVSCLPKDIPEHFEVDVSNLSIGDSIHVDALSIPNVEILAEGGRTVVVISAPTIVKLPEPGQEGAEAAVAPEVEGEEGEGAEGEAKADAKGKAKEGDDKAKAKEGGKGDDKGKKKEKE